MAVATSTALIAASMAATAVGTAQQMSASNAAAKTAEGQAQVSAEASSYQGYLRKELNTIDEESVAKQTESQVLKIRSAAQMMRGTQTAQMAASGVIVGDGSAQAAIDHTNKLAEQDTIAAMFSGVSKEMALKTGGRFAVENGNNTANATLADGAARAANYRNQATASLLSGVSSIAGTALKNIDLPKTIGGGTSGRAA